MMWLKSGDYKKQKYKELRLYAPESEKILLDFNPLKISEKANWNPAWEEWHCYSTPLRVYKQDYELLTDYFNRIYPIKDAFDGTPEPVFDVCFYNWIGKEDWLKIISEIEQELNIISADKKSFFMDFLKWLKKARKQFCFNYFQALLFYKRLSIIISVILFMCSGRKSSISRADFTI